MRFFSLIASAALAAVAVAQQSPVKITNNAIAPKAGETLVITYEPANIPVTLILKSGDGQNLQTVEEIGKSSSGSVSWTVSTRLTRQPYSLEIKPENGASNYVGPFQIQGATAAPSSASSTGSASSSPTASSGSVTRSSSGTASSSASVSVSVSSNGTVTSATLSPTTSGSRPTGSSATTTGSAPPTNTGGASTLAQSPMALVLGALAAFAYLA